MLLDVAEHNVSIQDIKVSKSESHITYSVTKHTYGLYAYLTLINMALFAP
jgi:hypothetical protein